MLLIFFLTVTLSFASSVHRYPFVFLLDVGNEELGKDNTEQIKVSVPGGSLAIKYPADGQGGVIGHVRVTGIDYGTDLKANIVEGGPGYRYVVLAFMGNTGVQYDTVVTIQTLNDEEIQVEEGDQSTSVKNSYEVDEKDLNNSAEETNDESEVKSVYSEKMNAEVMQSSSNMYNYVTRDNLVVDNQDDNLEEEEAGNIDESESDNNNIDDSDYNLMRNNIVTNSDTGFNYESDNSINSGYRDQNDNVGNNIEENNYENDDIQEDDTKYIKYQIENESIPNSDSSDDTVIPFNILSGYSKSDGFKAPAYGDVVLYPQIAVPQDRVLIDHTEDDDGQFDGEDEESNNNDYASPVDY